MDDRKTREKMLSWFLDFIQADLKGLTEEEMDIVNVELSHFYSRLVKEPREKLHLPKKNEPIVFSSGDLIHGDAQEIQSTLKDFLEKLLKKGATSVDLPMVKKTAILSDHGRYSIRYTRNRDIKGRKMEFIDLSENKSLLLPGSPNSELVPLKDIFTDYFFTYLLADLPRGVIKKCKECHRLFPHLSAKPKYYCSSYCAWKNLSRKRRDELKKHPRKYRTFLKKQREAMKRRYEEKRKTDLLLRKSSTPKSLKEKLTDEKLETDAMDYYKP